MKTVDEWSLQFDLMYNNIASEKAPGLTEYEKSVFLTNAQLLVVLALHNGSLGEAFESTESVTNYLSALVAQGVGTLAEDSTLPKLCDDSKVYRLPEDLLFITSEFCTLNTTCGNAVVVPVTQDEFWRTYNNPFKGPNKRRVLRLLYTAKEKAHGSGSGDAVVVKPSRKYSELVSEYGITEYKIRYIKRPEPIILTDLTEEGLWIEGKQEPATCKLDEALHHTILVEAVKAAKAIWSA